MTIVLQQGINGIVLGSLYVLVAFGLTLIYGVLVQINFAHADIVTLGAFAAYLVTHFFERQLFCRHCRRDHCRRHCRLARQRRHLRTIAATQ